MAISKLAIASAVLLLAASLQGCQNTGQSSAPSQEASLAPDCDEDAREGTFDAVCGVPAGTFNYGGSTTWAAIRRDIDPLISVSHPSYDLQYTDPPPGEAPGSGTGIEMTIARQLDFSQASRPIADDEYEQAVAEGFRLEAITVGLDAIAVAVNLDLDLPGVTVAQLQAIYSGEVTNWSEIGGPDVPIVPYSRPKDASGTIEFFAREVVQGEFGSNVEYVDETTLALQKVAQTPGGIYYASAPQIVGQCSVKKLHIGRSSDRLISPYQEPAVPPDECGEGNRDRLNQTAFREGDYPITRPLFVVIRADGTESEKAGRAYARLLLSDRAQELLPESGFVPIR